MSTDEILAKVIATIAACYLTRLIDKSLKGKSLRSEVPRFWHKCRDFCRTLGNGLRSVACIGIAVCLLVSLAGVLIGILVLFLCLLYSISPLLLWLAGAFIALLVILGILSATGCLPDDDACFDPCAFPSLRRSNVIQPCWDSRPLYSQRLTFNGQPCIELDPRGCYRVVPCPDI